MPERDDRALETAKSEADHLGPLTRGRLFMIKRVELKEDGRRLFYYSFENQSTDAVRCSRFEGEQVSARQND